MYSQAPEAGIASLLASRGRGEDTMLVHMTPGEVQALQGIANAAGGSLSLNPNTGLPEAGFLKELLPTIAGGLLKSVFPGMGELGIGLISAGIAGLVEGDLKKGLMAGMGAYGGAKTVSGLTQLGQENLARKKFEQEGVKLNREKLAEELGLRAPKDVIEADRYTASLMGEKIEPTVYMPDLDKLREAYVQREIESMAGQRPSMDVLKSGIGSLFKPKGFERFQSAVGGPKQLGFVVSPILGAAQRAEEENARKKFARSRTPDYYYTPGAFNFESGTFAPGQYYTAPGQPYTPKFGFADGGVVFQEGGETGTEGLKQYYQGLLTPPDTSQGEARRAETLAYLSALNQQLRNPPPGDTGIAPPGSGGTDIVGTPGGGSSIGNEGQPIGPGLPGGLPPVDMGGPTIGFDPSAGVGLPGQTLSEFLRDARTSVEPTFVEKPTEPVEEPELRPDEIAEQLPKTIREKVGEGILAVTEPYLNFVESVSPLDFIKKLVPGVTAAELASGIARKYLLKPETLEGDPLPDEDGVVFSTASGPEGTPWTKTISEGFDPTAGETYDPGSAIMPSVDLPFTQPYNPLEQNPLGGRGVGLNQQGLGGLSGAMGPEYNFGFAQGGLTGLPEYQAGGKLLRGPGDGMSDDIKANIDGKQEARLADGEFVVPADVVSHLGNGSTEAGAKKLYAMMDRIRNARTGSTKQGREINPNKFLPA